MIKFTVYDKQLELTEEEKHHELLFERKLQKTVLAILLIEVIVKLF